MRIATDNINVKKQKLQSHPLLTMNTIQSVRDLQVFMEHHVFAVWDFMCLAKTLQMMVCPAKPIWLPVQGTRNENARLINEIILCEESDKDMGGGSISHFDLYLQAMHEIGADTTKINKFLEHIKIHGPNKLHGGPQFEFVNSTFEFIHTKEAHIVASAFTFGRETVIPDMFKSILNQLQIDRTAAPKFYYYLERHIAVDEEEHGPAALKLVESLCDNDPLKFIEAERAALDSIDARIRFWDGVEGAILQDNSFYKASV